MSSFKAKMLNNNLKSYDLNKEILGIITEQNPKSVKQLISIIKDKVDLEEKEIINAILKLESKGKINFSKDPKALSFTSYMKNIKSVWYWTILIFEVITIILVFTIPENFYPWFYFRNIFGLIFVLILPGYVFVKAIFPIKILNVRVASQFEKIERLALSLGMSLALVSIIGLLLYYSPWGVEITPLVFGLLMFTLIFSSIALIREYRAYIN
jgi:hypothetical protein